MSSRSGERRRLRCAVVEQPSLAEQIRAVNDGPLLDLHRLGEHHHKVLRQPRRGDVDLSWVVGVGADATLVRHNFDSDAPHLLIAGSTGTGTGNLMSLMLYQLMHNNHPTDVRFWLVDFQREIADFRHVAHVERYIHPAATTDGYEAFNEMLEDAAAEVTSRVEALDGCPTPSAAAARSGADAAQRRPQRMQRRSLPSMFFIVKNTITFQYLVGGWDNQPANTETPMGHLRRIVEHGPRVGVRVAALTERPDMPALSADAVLKARSIILGLATADAISSRRFIGESGLEYLDPRYSKPGRGVMVNNGEAVQFRALSLGRGYGVAAGLAVWLARLPNRSDPPEPC